MFCSEKTEGGLHLGGWGAGRGGQERGCGGADGATAAAARGTCDASVPRGSVAQVPQALLAQLNDGGRLAAIVGQLPMMRFTLVRKNGHQFETSQPWDVVTARLANFEEPSRFTF